MRFYVYGLLPFIDRIISLLNERIGAFYTELYELYTELYERMTKNFKTRKSLQEIGHSGVMVLWFSLCSSALEEAPVCSAALVPFQH